MTTAIKINANDGKTRSVMAGGETEVDFDFPVFAATHLAVYETDTNGDIALLVKDTDYTVPAGSVGVQAGGTINLDPTQYPSGATAGHIFTIYQAAPEARTTDFNQAGDFFADTLNQELDLITQQIQQLRRDLVRAPLLPVDTTETSITFPDIVNSSVLNTDASGNLQFSTLASLVTSLDTALTSLTSGDYIRYNGSNFANVTISQIQTDLGITTFGASLIDDANAAAARTTLGLGTIATQDASNVSITGGSITGITDISIADGGTGASTAANARANLGVYFVSPELRPIISNNGTDPNKDIDIAAGRRVSSDGSIAMILASALTKQLDATWAAGTNAGGRSSSVSLSPSTWYHVFLIEVGGSVDVGFDTSVTAANLVTDHSATAYARIGSVLTDGSSNILAFTQSGNEFMWAATIEDVNVATSGTTASTRTLSVPTGVKVMAHIRGSQSKSATGIAHLFSSLDANDEAPTGAGAVGNHSLSNGSSTNGIAAAHFNIRTNTSAQIRTRASAASCSLAIETFGWTDPTI